MLSCLNQLFWTWTGCSLKGVDTYNEEIKIALIIMHACTMLTYETGGNVTFTPNKIHENILQSQCDIIHVLVPDGDEESIYICTIFWIKTLIKTSVWSAVYRRLPVPFTIISCSIVALMCHIRTRPCEVTVICKMMWVIDSVVKSKVSSGLWRLAGPRFWLTMPAVPSYSENHAYRDSTTLSQDPRALVIRSQ